MCKLDKQPQQLKAYNTINKPQYELPARIDLVDQFQQEFPNIEVIYVEVIPRYEENNNEISK